MQTKTYHTTQIVRELGDHLVLRRSTAQDVQRLADFNARIHSDEGPEEPDERLAAWIRDLFEKAHPTFNIADFTIVEDTETGEIVSSLNLISQTWSYAGIEFGVGRPELVGTHPDYRNRGLVRAQFEVIHEWSAARGEKMQAITGIPYYYRQFGYEMALNLSGGRAGYKPNVPKLKDGETEPCTIRAAIETDIPVIDELYRLGNQRYLVSCVWDEDLWRYELRGKSGNHINRFEVRMIEKPDGEVVGFFAHPPSNWYNGTMLPAVWYEVMPGVSWAEVTPTVIRYLYETGEDYAVKEEKQDFGSFGFWLGSYHPVYELMVDRLPRVRTPYAWYVRIPDIVDFLIHITPVLEERLAQSLYAGYSGEVRITCYRSGFKLIFEKGRLGVEAWQPTPNGHSGDAAFPNLTFLQLMLGYRSFKELDFAFADCWYDGEWVLGLLNALFPTQASDIWAVS